MTADFTEESAGAVLREACAVAGVDPSGAELMRLGSNAVYRLARSPVVVRIARDPKSLEGMTHAVRSPGGWKNRTSRPHAWSPGSSSRRSSVVAS